MTLPREESAVQVELLEQLAEALLEHATPAQRLEATLGRCAHALGVRGEFLSTPTSVQMSVAGHVRLVRAAGAETDLSKLVTIDGIARGVETGSLDAAGALEALREARRRSAPYSSNAVTLAGGVATASAAVFFGADWLEVGVTGLLGAGLGTVASWTSRRPHAGPMFEPLAALLVGFAAWTLAALVTGFSAEIVTLGALIMLVPGLRLTVAMTELASGHVVSGTARLAGAGSLFLSIAFGVALGRVAAEVLGGSMGHGVVEWGGALPSWAWSPALVIAAASFVVLFPAERSDAPWIVLVGVVGFLGAKAGGDAFGPHLGVFAGAMAVGLGGNAYTRRLGRPASVLRMPGILLLVPGGLGFRSASAFLDHDPMAGADGVFAVGLVAVALVTGLFAADVILPPRRPL